MLSANTDRLYADVMFLTSIRPYRNYKNVNSLKIAADYISAEFSKCGLEVELQPINTKKQVYHNVIASFNKEKSKRLIVGAHYDVAGNTPGADDNASAVAGLLETARLVSHNNPAIDYRIDFVAYCLEEPPFYKTKEMGSFVHAKSLWAENAKVMGMICFEMIGYFSDEAILKAHKKMVGNLASQVPQAGDFILVLGCEDYFSFNQKIFSLMSTGSAIDIQKLEVPPYDPLAQLSDHINYWAFSYDAVMITDTAFIRNPNYHKKSDTIKTLNFSKMAQVVNSTYRAVVGI